MVKDLLCEAHKNNEIRMEEDEIGSTEELYQRLRQWYVKD